MNLEDRLREIRYKAMGIINSVLEIEEQLRYHKYDERKEGDDDN